MQRWWTASAPVADEVSALSYELALAELDSIIQRLERGDVELDAAIQAYERGSQLARHCAALLDRTEQRVTQLVVGAAGEGEKPLQLSADRGGSPGPAEQASPPAEAQLFGEPAPAQPVRRARSADIDPDDIPF